ncbi:MAG: hypothetical protein KJ574_02320, partial [Nanoarchaeota archaeon]|nr:hypothetical protein [Nanoarchaeota archaeon]
ILNIPTLADERQKVRSHHERWDGQGYPDRRTGDAIPMLARVCSLADVYDALTSQRAYREQLTPRQAAEIVRDNAGAQFDPELAPLFYSFMQQQGFDGERILADNETKWIDLKSQGIIN